MFSITSCCFCFPNLHTYLIYLCCYLLIVVAAGSRVVHGLKCYCNTRECDVIRALDCPGKGLMLWDPCKCCRICAKTVGESCGGPGGFSGQCEPPLQCVTMLPITSGLGVCRELPISAISATYQNTNLNNNNYNNNNYNNNKYNNNNYKNNDYKNNDYKSINNDNKNNKLNCTKARTLILEPGCEITNTRCQCWPAMRLCRNDDDGAPTTDTRWHFKTLEDCQLNLQNLIQIEMEFDEDYTISPSTFTYKKLRRKRRSLRKKTSIKFTD